MKIVYSLLLGIAGCLLGAGCSKHLEEQSQDEVRPTTVNELQQLLMGEVYPVASGSASFQCYIDLMTDDMSSNWNPHPAASKNYQVYEGPFTWNRDMYEKMKNAGSQDDIDTYAHYYRRIMGCNVVLDMIDKVKGDESNRENVRGQALAMRAWCYFMLVNLYGQPYNAKGVDINTSPGVELVLSPIVHDALPARASVGAIYQQIEADLLKALPLMEKYGTTNSKFKVSDQFVHTLLSRMYLYMENWTKAAYHATQGLIKNSALYKLSNLKFPTWNYYPAENVYSLKSVEAIWLGYASQYEYHWLTLNPYGLPLFCVSPDLISKYEFNAANSSNRGDLRMRYYYYWEYTDPNWTTMQPLVGLRMTQPAGYNGATKGMRVAELYLNRAESNIQQYLKNGDEALRVAALADLNLLRSYRYDTRNVPYTNVDYSGTALLDFYRDERRRELSFEDHRWFDLRRYGMPEIRHKLQMYAGQAPVEYVLEKGSVRYVLPIPRSVLDKNPALVPNP